LKRWLLSVVGLATLLSAALLPSAAATPSLTSAERAALLKERVLQRGPLPKDFSIYEAAKAAAAARAGQGALPATTPSAGRDPIVGIEFQGQTDANFTPPDTTGAVGPTRYLELVNSRFGIYDRTGVLLDSGTLNVLAGVSSSRIVFDPQALWDPQTQRFYYAAVNSNSSFTSHQLAFGWSKTSNPTTDADWCKYSFGFGYTGGDLPDYPKLGDSQDFILIGSNVFDGGFSFQSADVAWVRKPAAGTTCPALSSFAKGKVTDLRDANGSQTFTPIPANQTDTSKTIVIVSNDPYEATRNFLTVFAVTPAGSEAPFAGRGPTGKSVPIASYSMPPPAPQPGTSNTLDTLDARVTQAVSAIDPLHSNKLGLWTQHTVAGGAGSQVRWYEIDALATNPVTLQTGTVTSGSLYAFNGAISPDRANNGATIAFGGSMVLGFNTSSSSQFPAIQMVSKVGAGAQSGFVMVQQSPGSNFDFSCSPCRWGDYAGAVPDPAASQTGSVGAVWLANQWNVAGLGSDAADWRTWIWSATP
jgi:hypothetical protein